MPYQLKQKTGALHLGKGRFFYPGVVYEDVPAAHLKYFDENVNSETGKVNESENVFVSDDDSDVDVGEPLTKTAIRNLSKEEQEALIFQLNGDPSEVSNAEQRISLILELQGVGE